MISITWLANIVDMLSRCNLNRTYPGDATPTDLPHLVPHNIEALEYREGFMGITEHDVVQDLQYKFKVEQSKRTLHSAEMNRGIGRVIPQITEQLEIARWSGGDIL